METVNCANCGTENKTNLKYCSGCGHELPKPIIENMDNQVQQLSTTEQTKIKNQKIKTYITVGITITVLFLIQNYFFKAPSFDKVMMQAASELNKTCPIMIDAETRCDNVIALPDNVFQYNYTLISTEKGSIDTVKVKEYITPKILNTVKTNPDLKAFRDSKVNMTYVYKDMNGAYLFKIICSADQYTE